MRLTLGGEPTFVAADDMEAAEWTTAADGADKRARGEALARRLLERFGPGGLLHYGQGKWYPGEPLPRWQIAAALAGRRRAAVERPALLADGVFARPKTPAADAATATDAAASPDAATDVAAGPNAAKDAAAALAQAIAGSLGLPEGCCIPGYEDPLHRLLVEARLPGGEPPAIDIDPTDRVARLQRRPPGRARCARRGGPRRTGRLGDPAAPRAGPATGTRAPGLSDNGPGRRPAGRCAGVTWPWCPGDSPMGLRLPLDALTWRPPPPEEPELSTVRRAAPAR